MNFYVVGLAAVLSAYASVSLAAAAGLRLAWPALRRSLGRVAPRGRAACLLALRLAPTAAGLILGAGLVLPAFAAFEPRDTREAIGPIVAVLGGFGLLMLAVPAVQLARVACKTADAVAAWSRLSSTIGIPEAGVPVLRLNTTRPLIALAGVRRPRLFIAAPVLDKLSARHIAAIAAHELAHLSARDNAKRLIWTAVFDPVAWSRAGREMLADWELAVEEAADEQAIAGGSTSRAGLAGALVAAARLAPSGSWPELSMSAFYRSSNLERRVRRLLEEPPAAIPRGSGRGRILGVTLLFLALGWMLSVYELRRPVQSFVELAVRAGTPSTSAGSR
jgi:Zn-dependent protease with chaperone function